MGRVSAQDAPTDPPEPAVLIKNLERHHLGPHLELLEDPSGIYTIRDVTSKTFNDLFHTIDDDVPSLGFSDSVWWVRFSVVNTTFHNDWLLEINYPLLDSIRLYFKDSPEYYQVKTTGDHLPFETRKIKHRNFLLSVDLPPHQEQTFYMRVETESSVILPLKIIRKNAFINQDHDEQMLFGLYYGIVGVMVLYNFFIFLFLRDRTYLFYVVYISVYILFQGCLNGYTYEYLWPGSPDWNSLALPFTMNASSFFSVLFAGEFLEVRKTYKRLYRWHLTFLTLSFIWMILSLTTPYSFSIRSGIYVAMAAITTMLTTGFISWRRNFRPARFFLIGWTIFLFGQFLSAVNKGFGFLPSNLITLHGGQIGSALEVILLSLGLADRINVIQEEKHKAQEEAIAALRETDVLNEKLLEANKTLEIKVAERTSELTRANIKLRELDTMKSEFLANVSHELRTPMTSVLGFAGMIQKKFKDLIIPNVHSEEVKVARAVDKVYRDVDIIVSEAQRLTTLINDVLDISRMEAGKMTWRIGPISFCEIIARAVASVSSLAEAKKLVLLNNCVEPLPTIYGDQDRILQVLINLLSNAVKFTEIGSITCEANVQGDEIVASIVDTGIGIKPHEQKIVFDKFKQVGDTLVDKPQGSGLGLPICKEIIEHHGGRIWMEENPEGGSVFKFTLPLQPKLSGNAENHSQTD